MNRLRLCLGTMITAAVLLLWAGAMAEIRINEVMASNGVYQDGHAYDWAELYNDGAEVSLAGWYLSNDHYQPYKWAFPSGAKIAENGYLIVYCAGEGKEPMTDALCTNFKLSADGDTPLLPAVWDPTLIAKACELAAMREGNSTEAAAYKASYDQWIEKMKASD